MDNQLPVYFLGGALGVLLQILFKIQNLKKQSAIANHSFSVKDYIKDDFISIISSFVAVGIAIYVIDELLAAQPSLSKYIKWFFIFVGYTGSSLIQSVLSATSKKINAIIDLKTNLADGVTPAVNATNSEAVVEIKKDEEKVDTDIGKES